MKKITSFLMMMVMCCLNTFAQFDEALTAITDLSELSDDAVYTIHSERTFLFYSDAVPDKIASGNGTSVGNVSWNPFDPNQQFKIKKIEDKYYLYSVGIQLYVNNEGYYGVNPETELKIMPAISTDYPWFLGLGSNFLNSQGPGQTPNGLAINTWGSNQSAHEDAGNHYNIYEVDMSQYDPYAIAFDNLLADLNTIVNQSSGAFIDNLMAGENVGTKPGNYRQENVDAFLALHKIVDDLMLTMETEGLEAVQALYPTPEDITKLNEDYVAAYNLLVTDKVPLAISNITPGYYTFNSCLFWYVNKQDTTFYTQEEADSVNAEMGYQEGDEGFVTVSNVKEVTTHQVAAPIKSLYSKHDDSTNADWMAWGTQEPKADFLWKIEAVEGKPTEYRMINMANGKTHISIGQSSNSRLELNDTATVCFDWRNDAEVVKHMINGEEVESKVVSFNIRSSKQAEGAYNYMHCGGHSSGAGTGSWIVGWADGGATRWYMSPVDEATADLWINGPAAQLRAMVDKGDSIAAAFPAQLKIATDLVGPMTDKPIASAENFYSPYHCPAEGNIAQLFDGQYNNTGNFWHSNWQSNNAYAYSNVTGTNYFVVEDINSDINGGLVVKVARRPVANDHLTELTVYGSNDAYVLDDDLANIKAGGEDLYEWTQLGVLSTPYGSGSEFITSNSIEFEGQYKFYKFVATKTTTNRGYFHMGEFQLYPVSNEKRYPTTQYDVRKAEADALEAAVAVWNEKAFSADSLELLEDESFTAAYNTLIAAGEAWGKVFVDPAALRAAIAAAPDANLFVIGNNPGQWKEGTVTPATVVNAAEAYNAAGAYTPAESEAHIAAIAKAEADVWAAANKVETGKWYRFRFATEEMYDTYGWGKENIGATVNNYDIETASALFNKVVAVGKTLTTYIPYTTDEGAEDTVTVYSVEATDEWYDGDRLGFYEEEFTEGEDLFQFIQATDSSYIIQNKATGLFVRGGRPMTLSAIPSYFCTNQALGAGGNAMQFTNVLGKADNQYIYMHAEQQTQLLTAWNDKSALKTMIMIEEVEAVNDVPTTDYMTKLWPGKIYTYTMPVDVTITEGAKAYAAELVASEEDTAIVLMAFEEKIKAGTPFIMIADTEGEYISTSDRLKEIASQICETEGKYGKNEQAMANTQLNDEYAIIEMNHGMEVDTVVTDLYSMRGTMAPVNVEPGKGIVANENGFAHIRIRKEIGAFGAWIASDFDPKSADVLSNLVIKIEGSVDTGINEVLNKVAKNGNIYNAAGQLVGKGNINTVNNLPAGIYVVNGVKVTKK